MKWFWVWVTAFWFKGEQHREKFHDLMTLAMHNTLISLRCEFETMSSYHNCQTCVNFSQMKDFLWICFAGTSHPSGSLSKSKQKISWVVKIKLKIESLLKQCWHSGTLVTVWYCYVAWAEQCLCICWHVKNRGGISWGIAGTVVGASLRGRSPSIC